MAPLLDADRNRSHRFHVFVDGLRRLFHEDQYSPGSYLQHMLCILRWTNASAPAGIALPPTMGEARPACSRRSAPRCLRLGRPPRPQLLPACSQRHGRSSRKRVVAGVRRRRDRLGGCCIGRVPRFDRRRGRNRPVVHDGAHSGPRAPRFRSLRSATRRLGGATYWCSSSGCMPGNCAKSRVSEERISDTPELL